jgi:hypothetical protein
LTEDEEQVADEGQDGAGGVPEDEQVPAEEETAAE